MRILLPFLAALALSAQDRALIVHLEPQTHAPAVNLDPGVLRSDLSSLLKENGCAEVAEGSLGASTLTLRPESFRLPDGVCALSAVAYLERPGQPKILRGRIIAALRDDSALALELRQAALDVVATLLNQGQGAAGPLRRMTVEGRPVPIQTSEVPFDSLKVRLHPLDPIYPPIARQRGVQGHVKARLTLDPEGRPLRADLVSGADELALTGLYSAMRWAFEPVRGPAGPMEARTVMDIPFSLSGGLVGPSIPLQDFITRADTRAKGHGRD
jgi:hypothetical protein